MRARFDSREHRPTTVNTKAIGTVNPPAAMFTRRLRVAPPAAWRCRPTAPLHITTDWQSRACLRDWGAWRFRPLAARAQLLPGSLPMRTTFRSLASFNYRLWAAGALVSNIGTWMQRTAQDWIVLTQLTQHDATAVGIVMSLQFGPQFLLLPLTGYAADRLHRRRMLVLTQSAMGLLALGLGILTLAGAVQLWHVYLFAFLLGCTTAFDSPTRQSFVAELVGDAHLSNAVALNSTSFNAGRLVGPAVAGVLIALIGSGWVFVLNAVSFAAVLAALAMLRPEEFHGRLARAGERSGLADGMRHVWGRPELRVVLLMFFLIGTFGMNFSIYISTMGGVGVPCRRKRVRPPNLVNGGGFGHGCAARCRPREAAHDVALSGLARFRCGADDRRHDAELPAFCRCAVLRRPLDADIHHHRAQCRAAVERPVLARSGHSLGACGFGRQHATRGAPDRHGRQHIRSALVDRCRRKFRVRRRTSRCVRVGAPAQARSGLTDRASPHAHGDRRIRGRFGASQHALEPMFASGRSGRSMVVTRPLMMTQGLGQGDRQTCCNSRSSHGPS
jgi:MFS family permease